MEGIYETLRTYRGVFAFMPEHQARLERSCAALGIKAPDLKSELEDFIGEKDVKIKLSVDATGRVDVESWNLPEWQGSFLYPEVWSCKLVDGARHNAEIKHTDTSFQKEERARALEEGYDEILMMDEMGRVTEGGITNVFFIEEVDRETGVPLPVPRIFTPGTGMLPGIGRSLVMKACKGLDIVCEEEDVYWGNYDSYTFFLVNSIRGIIATGEVLPVMQRVIDWCTDFINQRIEQGH